MDRTERHNIRKRAALDLQGGMNKEEVARKYGRTINWVRLIAKEFEIDLPKGNRAKLKYNSFKILKELYDLRMSMKKISARNSVTPQRVHQIYKMAKKAEIPGFPTRRQHVK